MHQVLNETAKGATGTALRVVYPELVVIPSTRRPMSFLVRCSKLYAFQEFLQLRSQGRRHPGCCVVLRQSWTGHNQILVVSDNRAAGQSLIAWLRSLILGLSGYVSSGTIKSNRVSRHVPSTFHTIGGHSIDTCPNAMVGVVAGYACFEPCTYSCCTNKNPDYVLSQTRPGRWR